MKLIFSIIYLCLAVFFSTKSSAQVVARFAGLEKDSTYMSLLTSESKLKNVQDSLNSVIKEKRALIADADDVFKNSLSKEIINLENQIFDLRGKLGILSTKIATVEKQFLLTNMSSSTTKDPVIIEIEKENSFLMRNSYFKSALEPSEYNTIMNGKKVELEVESIASKITDKYYTYTHLNDNFRDASSKTEADSLIIVIDSLQTVITNLDNAIGDIWPKLYQTKIDSYNILLDKMGLYDDIEKFGEKTRNERSRIADIQSTVINPQLSSYLRSKLILNEYELKLADARNLHLAKDSITQVMKGVDVDIYNFRKIEIPNWTFIDYKPAIIGNTTIYNDNNPIPNLIIPTVGDVYKVKLGTYIKKQTAYHIFRKISPIELREEAEGKVSYFAGSYRTYAEAKKMSDRLKNYGMKVSVARWSDGDQIADDGSIIEVKPAGDAYNVIIKEINDELLAIIKENADGKEIMKNDDGYSIGFFDDYDTAKALSDSLGNAKIVGITF